MITKKRSNGKFFLGITVAALLPISFYLITAQLSKGKLKLPGHYLIEKIDSQSLNGTTQLDTIYHRVGELELTNQLGEKVTLNGSLKGKSVVLDFFFTNCNSTCPKLSANMRQLQTSFKKDTKKEASLDTIVQFISITVDPVHDTVAALRAYADRVGANHDRWWFLTGDKKTIYNFIRNELGIATGPGNGGAEDFIHTEKFVLLDKDRFIRGYYDGLNDTDVRRCADDIVLLTLERKKKKKK